MCVRAWVREKKEPKSRSTSFLFSQHVASSLFRHTSKKNLHHRPVALKRTESSNVRKVRPANFRKKKEKKRNSAIESIRSKKLQSTWSQTFRQRVCMSVVCTFSSRYVLGLGPAPSPPAFSLLPPLFAELWFRHSSFPVFPFTVVIRFFFSSKGSKAFFPTVQLLTGTLTSKKYDRAIKNIRTKREQSPPGL